MIKYFKDKIRKRRARKLKCLLGGIHTYKYKYKKYSLSYCVVCGKYRYYPGSRQQVIIPLRCGRSSEFGTHANKTKTK